MEKKGMIGGAGWTGLDESYKGKSKEGFAILMADNVEMCE